MSIEQENQETQSQFVTGLRETSSPEVVFAKLGSDGRMDFQDLLNHFHESYTSVDYEAMVHNMDSSRSNHHYKNLITDIVMS